jgi:acetate kinase
MLEVAVRETHGYSSAAMVPAGVPSTAGVAEAAAVVQEESVKKVTELGLRLEEEQVAM